MSSLDVFFTNHQVKGVLCNVAKSFEHYVLPFSCKAQIYFLNSILAQNIFFVYRRHFFRFKNWKQNQRGIRDGTQTTWSFLAIFNLPPPLSWFYVVFRETPLPPKKTLVIFEKKWIFTGRLFTSQKSTGYHYYLLYSIKEIRYKCLSVSMNRGLGKKRWLRTKSRGGEDPKKMRIWRLRLLCAGSHHGSSKKNSQKDHVVFVGPPLPRRGLTWFYRESPFPPDHVVCVPSLKTLLMFVLLDVPNVYIRL